MTDLKCITCSQGYLHALRDYVIRELIDYFNIDVAIYDVDAILEVGTKFSGIFEWKMKKQHYSQYFLQSFEYVALKKLGKCMRTTPYFVNQILPDEIELIIESSNNPARDIYINSEFAVFEVNRFETKDDREFLRNKGVHYAVFDEREGRVMGFKEFRSWFGKLIMRNGGD